jgi:hypothetical protein
VAGAAVGMARGGFVTGPGTSTSDSIPARLSHGEYVLSAASVRKIGLEELNRINFGRRNAQIRPKRHFATGGLVQSGAKPSSGQDGHLTAVLGLEDGLVLKQLQSSEGAKAMVRVVGSNPRAFRRALGVE